MSTLELWELASYVVTVIGLPLAIALFVYEQRKERDNEEEEIFERLSDSYDEFLKLVLANPDLRLRSEAATPGLDDEQRDRMQTLFELLVSLFERAYLLAFEDDMNPRQARRWRSWEDYMREWCRREDFRRALSQLLQGEDPDFVAYLQRLADEEVQRPRA
jgi:hypothetical protein